MHELRGFGACGGWGKSAAVSSMVDIVLVVLASLAALFIEGWASRAGYLTLEKESTSIFAVMTGVLTALVPIRRQRFSDLGSAARGGGGRCRSGSWRGLSPHTLDELRFTAN